MYTGINNAVDHKSLLWLRSSQCLDCKSKSVENNCSEYEHSCSRLVLQGFITYCDSSDVSYLRFDAKIFNEDKSSSLETDIFYGDPSGVYTIQAPNIRANTSYQLNITIHDSSDYEDLSVASYSILFRTAPAMVAKVDKKDVTITNLLASLEIDLPILNSSGEGEKILIFYYILAKFHLSGIFHITATYTH